MKKQANAFAPANIALIKYWGKRRNEKNLPQTSSLSVSLPVGTHTNVSISDDSDQIYLNGKLQSPDSPFSKRINRFLSLFRPAHTHFKIETTNQIPTGAGLASSSSGFAALVLAFNKLLEWNLDKKALSILARQGSGSACRSIYSGFVEWHRGTEDDGRDSFAEPLQETMPELCLGIWMVSEEEKPIDSRTAMNHTVNTSPLYKTWPDIVAKDLLAIKKAIGQKDFQTVGTIAEQNALAMHATMMTASPPILYWLPESVLAMHKIWQWRKEGLNLYFTMDAGPNLKLLFQKKELATVKALIPTLMTYPQLDESSCQCPAV